MSWIYDCDLLEFRYIYKEDGIVIIGSFGNNIRADLKGYINR